MEYSSERTKLLAKKLDTDFVQGYKIKKFSATTLIYGLSRDRTIERFLIIPPNHPLQNPIFSAYSEGG